MLHDISSNVFCTQRKEHRPKFISLEREKSMGNVLIPYHGGYSSVNFFLWGKFDLLCIYQNLIATDVGLIYNT